MSEAIQGYRPRQFTIESLEGVKIDITNSIINIDYFEDIMSPSIYMMANCINKYSIVSNLPIRGGEKVEVDIETGSGEFKFLDEQDSLRVYKVSGQEGTRMSENFTLMITTQEYMNNEISRCFRKHTGKISESVKEILTNDLRTTKFKEENIEESANPYKYFGSNRKPFKVLEWLCPKTLSARGGETDPEPNSSTEEQAKGTMGYFFYENKEGFNFKSIDKLTELIGSSGEEKIFRYNYSGKIIKAAELDNRYKIIDYAFDRNIDMRSSLKFGMFRNQTYLFNVDDNEVTVYNYKIDEEVGNKKMTKQDGISVSPDLLSYPSRIHVRSTDNGMMSSGGGNETSGRSPADVAKANARYNLMFTQALNILVPCNVSLKVGDVIHCEFSEMDSGKSKEPDKQTSGRYLIRELRHHFSAGQNTTSLKLMRDSYGVN
tara:strand:- start:25 stop:1320 length:1296 start_codon:yes stop_codon:yes gene_type:complete